MGFIKEFISIYGNEILYTILTAIISFVGLKLKYSYDKYTNDKTKKQVVEDTVKYVEQIYNNLSSKKKFEKAKNNIIELLNDKNITITELELQILIESACNNLTKSSNTKNKDVKTA